MEVLREVTDWGEHSVPNHTYVLNKGGKMIGYRSATSGSVHCMRRPTMFDKRYRKFQKVVDKELVECILQV